MCGFASSSLSAPASAGRTAHGARCGSRPECLSGALAERLRWVRRARTRAPCRAGSTDIACIQLHSAAGRPAARWSKEHGAWISDALRFVCASVPARATGETVCWAAPAARNKHNRRPRCTLQVLSAARCVRCRTAQRAAPAECPWPEGAPQTSSSGLRPRSVPPARKRGRGSVSRAHGPCARVSFVVLRFSMGASHASQAPSIPTSQTPSSQLSARLSSAGCELGVVARLGLSPVALGCGKGRTGPRAAVTNGRGTRRQRDTIGVPALES